MKNTPSRIRTKNNTTLPNKQAKLATLESQDSSITSQQNGEPAGTNGLKQTLDVSASTNAFDSDYQEEIRIRKREMPIDLPLYFTAEFEWHDEQLLDYIVLFMVEHSKLIKREVLAKITNLQDRVNTALVMEVCKKHLEHTPVELEYPLVTSKEARRKRAAWFLPFPTLSGERLMDDAQLFTGLALVIMEQQSAFAALLDHLVGWERIRLAECLVIAEYKCWLDGGDIVETGFKDHKGNRTDPTPLQKLAWEEMALLLGAEEVNLSASRKAQLATPAAAA